MLCVSAVALRLIVACVLVAVVLGSGSWDDVGAVLTNAIKNNTFPGCVAIVASAKGTLYAKAFGSLTYDQSSPQVATAACSLPRLTRPHAPSRALTRPHAPAQVALDTKFDIASLSKVTACTTAAMQVPAPALRPACLSHKPRPLCQLYQRGVLDLDMPLADPYLLGPDFAQNGKSAITPRNLLLHNAGFPADPFPSYGSQDFGCPATNSSLHPPLTFSCGDLVLHAVLKQTLKNPVGAVFLYSDLSMITLSLTLGKLVQQLQLVKPSDMLPVCLAHSPAAQQQYLCWYEAYIRLHVFEYNPSSWEVPKFLPPDGANCPACNIAPAYYDSDYRHEQMWGQVSDANAYAMGGVSGHAGVFANAPALSNLISNILFASNDSAFVNATTVSYFIKPQNLSQVSLPFAPPIAASLCRLPLTAHLRAHVRWAGTPTTT
jgi:hypothetical protein